MDSRLKQMERKQKLYSLLKEQHDAEVKELMHYMSVLWGYAEVTPDRVTILAEIAEKSEDIDVDRAQAAVEAAQRRLETGGLPSEVEAARVSLEKARLRKRIAERTHRR